MISLCLTANTRSRLRRERERESTRKPIGKTRKILTFSLAADSILIIIFSDLDLDLLRPRRLTERNPRFPIAHEFFRFSSSSSLFTFVFLLHCYKFFSPNSFSPSTSSSPLPPCLLDHPPPFLVLLPDSTPDEKLLLPDGNGSLELIDGPGDRLLCCGL